MNHKRLVPSVALALLSMQPFGAAIAAEAASVSDMFTGGSASTSFRYRYESVDQDGIDNKANASTLKSRLTWTSAAYQGFKTVLEVDNVSIIGSENYKTPTNGMAAYPIVADPKGTDANQAYINYQSSDLSATLGRQRILHGGQRFVGGVGWRQNEQTFDALRLTLADFHSLKIDYSYIWNVNRIFGPVDSAGQAKQWGSDSHTLLASVAPAKGHSVTAFAYLLDFDNSAANSTSTYGFDYKGMIGKAILAASVAKQSDYGDNSASFDTDYLMAEVTVPVKAFKVAMGYELLGADNGVGFKTPLATLHKFQGWADKFLGTPGTGLEDVYLKVAGNVAGIPMAVFYHQFNADEGGADLGSEVDIVGTYKINQHTSVQAKYASYSADGYASDTDKLWLTLNLTF
jgi:hypothetical protein